MELGGLVVLSEGCDCPEMDGDVLFVLVDVGNEDPEDVAPEVDG